MRIKLLWAVTNDELMFDAHHPDLVEWFVTTSQQLGNNYSVSDMATDVPRRSRNNEQLIKEIDNDIDRVNEFIVRTMKQPPVDKPTNWCEQTQLNKLHKNWAVTRKKWPTLDKLLYKIDPSLFDSYHRMNCHIHLIENSFLYHFRDPRHWRVDNPFKDTTYEWEECHMALFYPGHGRTAFEKFKNLDEDLENFEIDNVNWNNVDPSININLVRPYKKQPPTEFLSWCNKYNVIPHNEFLPLGNLVDWRNNLTNARQLFMKNIKIPNNNFSLTII